MTTPETRPPRKAPDPTLGIELLFNLAAGAGGADPDRDLDEALVIAAEHLGMRTAMLTAAAAGRVFVERAYRPPQGLEPGDTSPLVESPSRLALERLTVVQVPDLAAAARSVPRPPAGQRAYLSAPVVVDGRPHGTLCLFDPEPREGGFSDAEAAFAMKAARWLGAVVARRKHLARVAGEGVGWGALLDAAGGTAAMVLEPERDDAGAAKDFVFRSLSPAASALLHERSASPLGKRLLEIAPEARNSALFDVIARAADGDGPLRESAYLPGPARDARGARWFQASAMAVGESVLLSLDAFGEGDGAGAPAGGGLDAATGLRDRAFFDGQASRRLEAGLARGRPAALVVVRLDGLEEVRERIGRDAASSMAAMAARRMERLLRPSDLVIRFDENAFVVLPRLSREGGEARIAERLSATLEAPFIIEGEEVEPRVRVAGAAAGSAPVDAEALVREALGRA